jgi:hypothetical protein
VYCAIRRMSSRGETRMGCPSPSRVRPNLRRGYSGRSDDRPSSGVEDPRFDFQAGAEARRPFNDVAPSRRVWA